MTESSITKQRSTRRTGSVLVKWRGPQIRLSSQSTWRPCPSGLVTFLMMSSKTWQTLLQCWLTLVSNFVPMFGKEPHSIIQVMILTPILPTTARRTKLLLRTRMISRNITRTGMKLLRKSRVSVRRTQCLGGENMMISRTSTSNQLTSLLLQCSVLG